MEKHLNDIDLRDIYQKIESKKYSDKSMDPDDKASKVIEYMEEYCLLNGLQKDYYKTNSIIINSDDNFYQTFLSCQLAFCDKHKIPLLLDYHQAKYTEIKGLNSKAFKDFIENRVLTNTNRIANDPEETRAEKIADWIRNTPETTSSEPKVQNSKNEVNKYPKIFVTANDYNFFEALLETTVPKENPNVADFAFIYHKLYNQKPNAIHHHVKHKIFIDFVNKEYNAEITDYKLNKREPKYKMPIYNSLFNKFYSNSQ
jgi:hypothetical protein